MESNGSAILLARPWRGVCRYRRRPADVSFDSAGNVQILDASDFGVAQTRKRLFIVGDLRQSPNVITGKRKGRRRSAKSILGIDGKWQTTALIFSKSRGGDSCPRQESYWRDG
jgi:site-specific DNA-cytosine methylase